MIQKSLINSLTDHLQHAVLVINQNGELIYCNDSSSQFWQKDSVRIKDKQIGELFHADETIQEKIREVFDSGKVFKLGRYVLNTPPLHERGAEIVIAPILDLEDRVEFVIMTMIENTHLQESQARENEEQIAISLGNLVADLAHEIQNPLSGVKGILQLLERDLKKSEINTTYTRMMQAELERVERLLKQLLFHSHTIPLDETSFDIHDLLNTILHFEQNIDSNIRFIRSFDTSLPYIKADRDKLHQVLLNLIRNAVEASSNQVVVKVNTRYCGKWELAGTNLDPQRSYILISIEDEGEGISFENRNQLFKPLFTTKEKGHGLGLSISHRLVKAHDGLLRYYPANSKGSVFQIFLPQNIQDFTL